MRALFDTNILIDFLNAVPESREELARFSERAISITTWMEVLIGAERRVEAQTRQFLDTFTLVPLGSVTRNTKDFSVEMPGIRVPYEL